MDLHRRFGPGWEEDEDEFEELDLDGARQESAEAMTDFNASMEDYTSACSAFHGGLIWASVAVLLLGFMWLAMGAVVAPLVAAGW